MKLFKSYESAVTISVLCTVSFIFELIIRLSDGETIYFFWIICRIMLLLLLYSGAFFEYRKEKKDEARFIQSLKEKENKNEKNT